MEQRALVNLTVKIPPAFVELEASLSCSHELDTGPRSETDEPRPRL